jgi:hypothetical protein
MKINQILQAYLVDVDDVNIYNNLFDIVYGSFGNLEDEILLSIHLLKVWVESAFNTPDSNYLEESTCDFLKAISDKIREETGYIIFRIS